MNQLPVLSKRNGKVVHVDGTGFGIIALYQNSRRQGSFSVQYGVSLKTGLTYSEACTALGAAYMHRIACDGNLDNERN